jgi:hypothetical protein
MAKQFIATTLMDGYVDGPHITEVQTGIANQGLYGPDDYVLDEGKKAEAQILTNNSVRVFDATFVIQGRRDVMAANAYADVTIANGEQGMYRNDIIVRKYEKDEMAEIENTSFDVIKGTPSSGVATDPEIPTGDIRTGATMHNMALYRVKLEGLNIVALEPMFKVLYNMADIKKELESLNSKIDPYRVIDFNTTGRTTYVKYANGVMIQFGIASVSYTDGYGTATFAHPFIDTSYAFFTTGVYVNSTYPFEIITCQKISNNKTYIYSRNLQGNKVETHTVDWLAIGKWK